MKVRINRKGIVANRLDSSRDTYQLPNLATFYRYFTFLPSAILNMVDNALLK